MTREKLGSVWSDTATLLIADPCRVLADRRRDREPEWDYDRLVELHYEQGTPYTEPAIISKGREIIPEYRGIERAEHVKLEHGKGGVAGIAVNVGCDGWYPVWLHRDAKGEPVRIVIELGGKVDP